MKKQPKHKTPGLWKVRWCAPCSQYEFDTGSPRGWVKLLGEPPKGCVVVARDAVEDALLVKLGLGPSV